MCGGGARRSTITVPDTKAYDRALNQQIAAMQAAQSGAVTAAQGALRTALDQEQSVLAQLRDLRVARANDTAANASRIAALLGPPPPEKGAMAPVVGTDRSTAAGRTGRKQLRVDRTSDGAAPAAGAGLNFY
jgi:hypothetical protein